MLTSAWYEMTLLEKIRNAHETHTLLIGGHRGHLSDTRENTIANFNEILDLGLAYIEIDVQLTRDGQAVIFHDLDLSERTPLQGMIKDYTLAELQSAFEINTMEQAIQWCKEHNVDVLLEIKNRELDMGDTMPELAGKIVSCLDRFDFHDHCMVFGTDHRTLKQIKQADSRIHLALIVPHIPHDPVGLMRDMEADVYLCYINNQSAGLIRELHAAGFYVDGSVINDPIRLDKALEIGVDMIESDNPAFILKEYEKRK